MELFLELSHILIVDTVVWKQRQAWVSKFAGRDESVKKQIQFLCLYTGAVPGLQDLSDQICSLQTAEKMAEDKDIIFLKSTLTSWITRSACCKCGFKYEATA